MKKPELCYFCAQDKRRTGRHLISRSYSERYGKCVCCGVYRDIKAYISVPERG